VYNKCRYIPKQGIRTALINDILLACSMIMVSGCSIPYAKTISQYENAALCCSSMDKFTFEALQVGDSKSFDLNEKSPAYQFLTGKSYFKAFLLPQSSYPYVVTVTSYMVGDTIDSAYIFCPRVITLYEDREPIRSTDPNNLKLIRAGFFETLKETGGIRYKLEVELPFTENNKTEKYLIVLTTSELLRAKTSLSTLRTIPIIFPGVVGVVPVGTEEVLIPHSPAGHIKIILDKKREPHLEFQGASWSEPGGLDSHIRVFRHGISHLPSACFYPVILTVAYLNIYLVVGVSSTSCSLE
jgi:hypothetical protein